MRKHRIDVGDRVRVKYLGGLDLTGTVVERNIGRKDGVKIARDRDGEEEWYYIGAVSLIDTTGTNKRVCKVEVGGTVRYTDKRTGITYTGIVDKVEEDNNGDYSCSVSPYNTHITEICCNDIDLCVIPQDTNESKVSPAEYFIGDRVAYAGELYTITKKERMGNEQYRYHLRADDMVSHVWVLANDLQQTRPVDSRGAVAGWLGRGIVGIDPAKPGEDKTVNHPPHYTSHPSGIECITITQHHNFCIGNAIKYLWRAGLKDNNPTTQDLKKAVWYIEQEIKRVEESNKEVTV